MPRSFAECVIIAMDAIEQAHARGILLYGDEYSSKHQLPQAKRIALISGLTTHDILFEQYCSHRRYPIMKFRLKERISASLALTTLLSTGETVIDCMTAISIAYNYAVLLLFEDKYGSAAGKARFDALFGTEVGVVPKVFRLFFGNNMHLYGHITDPVGNVIPLTALSYIFEDSQINKLAQRLAAAKTPIIESVKSRCLASLTYSSFIAFAGYLGYSDKHPQGNSGNYNCIVQGFSDTRQPLLRVFGLGNDPLTEKALLAKHIEAHNFRCTEDDLVVQADIWRYRGESSYKDTITADDVPGLSLRSHYAVVPSRLELLLNDSPAEVIIRLTGFLNECIKYRREHQIRGMREDEDLTLLSTAPEIGAIVRFSPKVAVSVVEMKEEKAPILPRVEEASEAPSTVVLPSDTATVVVAKKVKLDV